LDLNYIHSCHLDESFLVNHSYKQLYHRPIYKKQNDKISVNVRMNPFRSSVLYTQNK
jgi:hypothetical protein